MSILPKALRRLADRPLVAIDWSWLRALRRPHLPNRLNFIVPEVAMLEAMDAQGRNPEDFTVKLARAFDANQDKFFFAKHWTHVTEIENTPGSLASRSDIIYFDGAQIDSQRRRSRQEWAAERRMREELGQEHDRAKSSFDSFKNRLASELHDRATSLGGLEGTEESVYQHWITRPEAVLEWICDLAPRFDTPEWRVALAVFPDRHAVGRWWRAWMWQAVRAARLSGERIRNDAEDSDYLFVDSYADELWTCDKDLAESTALLFPTVAVTYRTPSEV